MNITINRLNDAYHFEATNDTGNTMQMDGSPDIGGENKGFRPMQTLLTSLGGCSAIDIIMMLKKSREPVEDIKIELTGDRHEDRVAKTFKKIHVHYILKGQISPKKVERAVNLSMETYCSVGLMLQKACEITHSFEIID